MVVLLKHPKEKTGWSADAFAGLSQGARGLSIAGGFVVAVIGCWLLGRLLDGWLNTDPWFQVVGAVLGWGLGFLYVYYVALKESE